MKYNFQLANINVCNLTSKSYLNKLTRKVCFLFKIEEKR